MLENWKQTFMRQKVTLTSKSSDASPTKEASKDQETGSDSVECKEVKTTNDMKISSRVLSPKNGFKRTNGSDFVMKSTDSTPFSIVQSQNTEEDDCSRSDASHLSSRSSTSNSSKVNDNSSSSGVLRYALHLRFLCPALKKNLKKFQKCKAEPSSVPITNNSDIEGERRFYLYNDLRVVFPQRHSDADEGEVFTFVSN